MTVRPGDAEAIPPWRRSMVAGALAIVLFTLISVPTWFLIPLGTQSTDGWADLGYFAFLLIVLMVTPPIAIGIALAFGPMVDRRTVESSPQVAAGWFAQLAAVPAVVATLLVVFSGPVSAWLPFVNLVIPAAGAGALTRLLLAKVLGSRLATTLVLLVTAIVAAAPLMLFVLTRMGAA